MEVWCHLVVSVVVVLAHGTMVRRSSKQHMDMKSAADRITGGGESGRRWRVVWWRWKWREPLQRASLFVCVRVSERERERRVVGRLCKFFFTAGWRVKNGDLECTADMARGRYGWINTRDNVIPTSGSTFFCWLFGQRMWQFLVFSHNFPATRQRKIVTKNQKTDREPQFPLSSHISTPAGKQSRKVGDPNNEQPKSQIPKTQNLFLLISLSLLKFPATKKPKNYTGQEEEGKVTGSATYLATNLNIYNILSSLIWLPTLLEAAATATMIPFTTRKPHHQAKHRCLKWILTRTNIHACMSSHHVSPLPLLVTINKADSL